MSHLPMLSAVMTALVATTMPRKPAKMPLRHIEKIGRWTLSLIRADRNNSCREFPVRSSSSKP